MSVRFSGLISSMTEHSERLWHHLDQGLSSERTRSQWLTTARRVCTVVEEGCQEADQALASLPQRSRDAYAWFALLSEPDHLDVHLAALRLARRASRQHPSAVDARPVVLLQPMQSLWRARHNRRPLVHHFTEALAAAPDEFWGGFFAAFAAEDMSTARRLLRAASATEEATLWMAEMDATIPDDAATAVGRHYDLDAVFARVNDSLFAGAMQRPQLVWTRRETLRTFGHYQFVRDRLTISKSLDSPDVSPLVIDFIMFHELLHKKHGLSPAGNRLVAHTDAFRRDERTFPDYDLAERELKRLARRMRRR